MFASGTPEIREKAETRLLNVAIYPSVAATKYHVRSVAATVIESKADDAEVSNFNGLGDGVQEFENWLGKKAQAARAADHQSSSNWAWAGNFKRNHADGTRTGPSSKAMFLKLNTQWPQGANPRSGPAGAGTAPAGSLANQDAVMICGMR